MKVHTETISFKADEKLLDFIEKKLNKIDNLAQRATEANVVLKLDSNQKIRDKIVEVRVHVPGETLVAKATDKTFEASVHSAVDALRRQVLKYKEKWG